MAGVEDAQVLSRLGRSLAAAKDVLATTKDVSTKKEREEAEEQKRTALAVKEYGRGKKIRTNKIKDPKTRRQLTQLEIRNKEAAIQAKDAELLHEHDVGMLEPEGELERTYRTRQSDIKSAVGVETAKKGFELKLEELGPYKVRYSRNGRDLIMAGRKGHVATMQWRDGKLGCELQLGEHVRDACWLHNSNSFAVAQARKVYIYDQAGVELHQLDNHTDPLFLQFLPYHFLLASLGNHGWLKYMDTSTGQFVAEMSTKKGTPTAFAKNPHNAILHSGHQNGTVQLWSPNTKDPLVKILAHKGPVTDIAVDKGGSYMVTTGADHRMSVWDIRAFKPMHNYYLRRPGCSVNISDRNLTAVGWGTQMTVWRGLFDLAPQDQERTGTPYLQWGAEGKRVETVRWCPFEDVLGIGHSHGFSSVLVPGAGEPNFDALEANPYETVKQRQESEVHSLLTKLQPGMISLDPNFIGNLDLASHEKRMQERDLDKNVVDKIDLVKNRGRGRNSTLRKLWRKEKSRNIVGEERGRLEELMQRRDQKRAGRLKQQADAFGPALSRFARGR